MSSAARNFDDCLHLVAAEHFEPGVLLEYELVLRGGEEFEIAAEVAELIPKGWIFAIKDGLAYPVEAAPPGTPPGPYLPGVGSANFRDEGCSWTVWTEPAPPSNVVAFPGPKRPPR